MEYRLRFFKISSKECLKGSFNQVKGLVIMWAGSSLLFDDFSKYLWNKDAEALAEAVPNVTEGRSL